VSEERTIPRRVRDYEKAHDNNDPWWLDEYHPEDLASIAEYYRARVAKLEETLQEIVELQPEQPEYDEFSDLHAVDYGVSVGRWNAAEIARNHLDKHQQPTEANDE